MITFPSRKQPFSGGVREGTWCRNACWYPQGPHSSSSSNLALFSILFAESFKEESRVCPQTWGRECANGADMQWRGNKEPAAQGCSQKHSGVLGKPFIAQKGFLNCKTSGWTRLLSVPTATPSLSVVLQTVTDLVTVCGDRLWYQPPVKWRASSGCLQWQLLNKCLGKGETPQCPRTMRGSSRLENAKLVGDLTSFCRATQTPCEKICPGAGNSQSRCWQPPSAS